MHQKLRAFLMSCTAMFFLAPAVFASCSNPGPGWIACEDFENGEQGWQTWFDSSIFVECNGCNGNVNNPARILLTNSPANVHSGQWALSMPAESSAGFQGASLIFRSCNGAKRPGCVLTGYDKLYFRVWVKLAPNHQLVHHFLAIEGSRLNNYWESDGNAGCRPNGTRWAGTTLDFNTAHELFFYTYFPEMHCDQGGYCSGTYAQDICTGCATKNMPCTNGLECCWGNLYEPSPAVVLPRGQWVCREIMMQLNTVGNTDGEMAFWINDSLALRVTGMHWRDVPELQLNKAWLQHYIASGDATQSNQVWFDDMVVSTQKIGSGTVVTNALSPKQGQSALRCQVISSQAARFSAILAEPGDFSIGIFSVTGRKIWAYHGNSGYVKNINVDWSMNSAASSGVYLAHLNNGKSSMDHAFIF
jgi:hypothetical protein